MNCDRYRQYELDELDELDEASFRTHAAKCAECQAYLAQDTRLFALARTLQQPVETDQLWERIKTQLCDAQRKRFPGAIFGDRKSFYLAAAMVVVGIGLAYLTFKPPASPSLLLSESAVRKVEETEREYQRAIDELEIVALPQLAHMDTALAELYRERLSTIDAQIDRCRNALESNPDNAHIRRYMLAALQDKKETLQELLRYKPGT
jgi:hypothetical protein